MLCLYKLLQTLAVVKLKLEDFQALILQLLNLCVSCKDQSCLHLFLCSSNIWSVL